MRLRPFLALLVVAPAALAMLGLPYGRTTPETFAHAYTHPVSGNTTHLHIDADITNGTRPCDPIDDTATVTVGSTHKVGVCLEDYEPNSVEAFELHVRYTGDPSDNEPPRLNLATEVECDPQTQSCLEDNPDANDSGLCPGEAGGGRHSCADHADNDGDALIDFADADCDCVDDPTRLGVFWDCNGFRIMQPYGDDPHTPNVADAFIFCNAPIVGYEWPTDKDLTADPGLLATIEFTATSPGVDTIDFGPIDVIGNPDDGNKNAVGKPRPGAGIARCTNAVPADQVGCFGATIEKVLASEQLQLKAPWRGAAIITQGNHGEPSHKEWDWGDNTFAIDIVPACQGYIETCRDVLAPADGVVEWVHDYFNDQDLWDSRNRAGGRELVLRHEGPTGEEFWTVYLHLSQIEDGLQPGDPVKQGQVIGECGNSGYWGPTRQRLGTHLHFHIWDPPAPPYDSHTWPYDSHTQPIERLEMRHLPDGEYRAYDARNGDLDDAAIHYQKFESNNPPVIIDKRRLVGHLAQTLLPMEVPSALASLVLTVVWGGSTIEVTLVSPSGREVACPSSDPDVLCNQGATFQEIALDEPEAGEWTVILFGADVPQGGEEATVTASGDPQPIVVGDNAPMAAIISPASGAALVDSVLLEGLGYDPEDGDLQGSSLQWISDVDGFIGDGTSFSTDSLSLGDHTITLLVSDSEGNTASDAVAMSFADNCPTVDNPGQENADSGPPPSGTGLIGNGKGIPGDDATIPNGDSFGDACDDDLDNDGIPNASDSDPSGDITYDDNNDGNPCPPLGTDASDDGPSWDSNCNAIIDGMEGQDCGTSSTDTDGDGLMDAWENCKWATNPAVTDSDGDGMGDCLEAADVDGNGVVDFVDDVIYYAKAALLWPCPSPTCFGKDGDFDINGDGIVDFVDDVIQEAKFALIAGLCQ